VRWFAVGELSKRSNGNLPLSESAVEKAFELQQQQVVRVSTQGGPGCGECSSVVHVAVVLAIGLSCEYGVRVPCNATSRIDVAADHLPLVLGQITDDPKPVQKREGSEGISICKCRVDFDRPCHEGLDSIEIARGPQLVVSDVKLQLSLEIKVVRDGIGRGRHSCRVCLRAVLGGQKSQVQGCSDFACNFGLEKYSSPLTEASRETMAMPVAQRAIREIDTTFFK